MAAKKTPARPTHRKAYGVTILNSRHKDIRRIRANNAPAIHGNKCWTSSYMIMNYLDKHGLPKKRGSSVMEVGCGWALTSIYCAKKHGAKVVGTDADTAVFPYAQLHAEINGVDLKTYESRFEQLTVSELSNFDFVVGGDICFWDKLVNPLYKLIENSLEAGVKQIIIADLGRSPFEKLAKRCIKNFNAEKILYRVTKPVIAHGYLLIINAEDAR